MRLRLALPLLLLAACGSDPDDDDTATTSTSFATASASASSTATATTTTTGATTSAATDDGTSDSSSTGDATTGTSAGPTTAATESDTEATTTTTGTTGGDDGPPYTCPPDLEPCPAFPGASWESREPAALGLDAGLLDQLAAATGGGRGCVFRYGYQALCWGNPGEKFEWASASKPAWSTFLLFAVAEGRLADVDALIADWDWPLSAADQGMSFRHLANQVSGYALPEPPGAAWGYNDYAIKLYARTLFERVFADGGDANQVAGDPARLGPLGFQDGPFFAMVKGAPRVSTTPRDFARFGWLWANHGRWGDAVIVPPDLIEMALEPGVPGGLPRTAGAPLDDYLGIGTAGGGADQTPLGPGTYAFNWWLNTNGATWPSAPADTIQANGHWNGEVLTVIPSLGIVAAWKGKGTDAATFNGPMDSLLALLVAAAE
ncbi:MAG: serine hydrolase [Myxococcales bacterium]|nr:serine hydrolase [Myxococcales bacterium]